MVNKYERSFNFDLKNYFQFSIILFSRIFLNIRYSVEFFKTFEYT